MDVLSALAGTLTTDVTVKRWAEKRAVHASTVVKDVRAPSDEELAIARPMVFDPARYAPDSIWQDLLPLDEIGATTGRQTTQTASPR